MSSISDTITPTKVDLRPTYVGTKIVKASPMEYEAYARKNNKWTEGQETMGSGYEVQYEDGYLSWSPKSVFERCYREITSQEKIMIN